jgi:CRP-like cAMP-binding protein
MDVERATRFLGEARLFQGLTPDELVPLAERANLRTFDRGQTIFYEGDPAHSLFVVIEGGVKVFVTSENGDQVLLVTLGPSDVFGEVALLDGGERSASAEALEKSRLLELRREPFLELLHTNPKLHGPVLEAVGQTVRRLTEQTSDLVFLDLHGRVAKLLTKKIGSAGKETDEGIELDLGLTQGDIGAMVGGSRQSVNQILRSFERSGLIEITGRKVLIKDRAALERRASG